MKSGSRIIVAVLVMTGLGAVAAWQYWPQGDGGAAAVDSADPGKATAAMDQMARKPTPQTLEKLAAKRQDKDPQIARGALDALSTLATPEAVQEMTQALQDERLEVQQAALVAIARTRADLDPTPVIAILKKPNQPSALRAEAFECLGARKVEQAIPQMLRALNDPDPDVRGRAYMALRRVVEKDYQFPINGTAAERAARIRIISEDLARSRRVRELISQSGN